MEIDFRQKLSIYNQLCKGATIHQFSYNLHPIFTWKPFGLTIVIVDVQVDWLNSSMFISIVHSLLRGQFSGQFG